jgi:hypothetical protein
MQAFFRLFRRLAWSVGIPPPGKATSGGATVDTSTCIGFIGLRFYQSDGLPYAWARVRALNSTELFSMVLAEGFYADSPEVLDWAYESRPNTPIIAGDRTASAPVTDVQIVLTNGVADVDVNSDARPRHDQKLAGVPFPEHIGFVLPDEKLTPEQIAIFRQMTPERRLLLAEQLYWTARELKAAWLHARHPEWTEQQVAQEVTRLFLHART